MKSIVLCESTLVEQSDHGKELKEAKGNENGNEEISKKLTNGNSGEERSEEAEIINVEENSTCNRKKEIETKEPAEKESCENDEKSVDSAASLNNSTEVYSVTTDEEQEGDVDVNLVNSSTGEETESTKKIDTASHNEVSCSDVDGHSEEDLLKSFNGRMSRGKRKSSSESGSGKEDDSRSKTRASIEEKTSKEDSTSDVDIASDKTSSKESLAGESNGNIESEDREQLMDEILLDEDENKENEKERKMDFSEMREEEDEEREEEEDSSNEQSSGCEIQVSECQTISESDKNSMWNEKPEQDSEENTSSSTQEKSESLGEEFHNSGTNEEKEVEILKSEEGKKEEEEEEDMQIVSVKHLNGEVKSEDEGKKEEEEDDMQIVSDKRLNGEVKSEDEETEQMDLEESYPNQTVKSGKMEEDKCSDSRVEYLESRKRQLSDGAEKEHSAVKKKRLSEDVEDEEAGEDSEDVVDDEEVETVVSSDAKSKENYNENSSRPESPASRDTTTSSSSKGQSKSEKVSSTKKTYKKAEKSKTSKDGKKGEKPKCQPEDKEALTSSFLTSLRGTLKSLTRSDLEELIVQKLCEAITERSNVGELRRKAQALEQDQERWKEKVQSLTKLVREMEMVMKKYMTEVQKQVKEKDSQMVIPIKVTRSVGLQVSFFSSGNKAPKSTPPQPATSSTIQHPATCSPVQNVNGRNTKPAPMKIPSQLNVYPKTVWNKSPVQKTSLVNHQKKSMVTRSDYGGMHHNRSSLPPQSLLHSSRGIPNHGIRHSAKSAPQTPQHQKPQQQNNNSSKVIDLTEDDDRQTGSVGRTTGPIRVVNHLSQQSQQVSQNNRYAYILPTSTAPPTGISTGGQSRQVLIATPTMPQPNRQLMCSMPPLLFKGGNVVQQQGPQSQIIQSNRIVYPKSMRHPAPLPQPPVNQINRPNLKLLPPRPALKISKVQSGIVLSWNMSLSPEHAPISSYQLYAYQESNSPPATSLWKKVGDVKALPLPMACTLTQFMSGHKYHFAVRAVDLHSRIGPFSFPGTIVLVK